MINKYICYSCFCFSIYIIFFYCGNYSSSLATYLQELCSQDSMEDQCFFLCHHKSVFFRGYLSKDREITFRYPSTCAWSENAFE